jgi:hypothetical protein
VKTRCTLQGHWRRGESKASVCEKVGLFRSK